MKKRFLSITLVLCMLLSIVPLTTVVVNASTTTYTLKNDTNGKLKYGDNPVDETGDNGLTVTFDSDNQYAGDTDVTGYILNGGTYRLGDDVTITQPLIIQGTADNKTVLDLNGHVLQYKNDDTDKKNSVIVVANDAYFVLEDGSPSTTHYFTKDDTGLYTLADDTTTTGTITLTGGIITGGTGTAVDDEYGVIFGGGVFVGSRATFTMTGGNIVGCTVGNKSNSQGGGVFVSAGKNDFNKYNIIPTTFTMTGGSIVGCTATEGGGVYEREYAEFTMDGTNDARIANCTAKNGGGVYLHSNSKFTIMNGGTIENCAATNIGGGVNVGGRDAPFTMKGGTIKNCTATNIGGGVYLGGSGFEMQDGTIENCTADNGGGVGINNSESTFTMKDGTVKDCTAKENGNGVCIGLGGGTMDAQGGSVYGGVYIMERDGNRLKNTSTTGSTIFYSTDGEEAIVKESAGEIVGKRVKFMDGENLYAETVASVVQDEDWSCTFGNGKITLPTLTRDGYAFGWYKDIACTQKWDSTKTDGENDASFNMTGNHDSDYGTCTLYAGWTPVDYTITYYYGLPDDVAAPTNPTTYTVESTDITLTAPTWDLHSFLGWTYEGQTEPVLSVTIPTGSTGDRTYTANWKELYTVTFDPNGGTVDPTSATTDIDGKLTLTELPTPIRSGSYRFDGWFTEKNGGTAVTVDTVYEAHTTVYAHWTYTGGSSRPSYAITVPETEHGTVKVSPRYAERGDTVTITVTPDSGYTLETLTVLDKNGKEIELTDKGDGKYTFKMPSGKVEVKATFAEDNSMLNFFVDVTADKYYYNAVLWAAKNGITGGIDENHFGPDLSCTRAQLVTFLWRAAGCPVVNYAMDFSDVGDSYYTEAVRWAASLGIVGGYGNGLFGSDDAITREQFVTILYRFAVAMGYDVSVGEDTNILSYNDVFEVSEYAIPAFQWATGAGVVQGNDGNLMPKASCTRAQIVTMLYRLLGQ